MASSKKKQIRLKKVTVSKPRNLISFAFNIAAISLIGITTTLFLISSLITWNGITDWYSGYARSSFFWFLFQQIDGRLRSSNITTDMVKAAVGLATIAYLLFIWARFLRSQYKLHEGRSLLLMILINVFLMFGMIFVMTASPSVANFVRDDLEGYFAISVVAAVCLATGFIINIIFNHIYYHNSLILIILPSIIMILQILNAMFLWNQVNIDDRYIQGALELVSMCASIILVWLLLSKLIHTQIINSGCMLNKIGVKLSKIFLGLFISIFAINALLHCISLWYLHEYITQIAMYTTLGFSILFTGYLVGLALSISSGIYLNQSKIKSTLSK